VGRKGGQGKEGKEGKGRGSPGLSRDRVGNPTCDISCRSAITHAAMQSLENHIWSSRLAT